MSGYLDRFVAEARSRGALVVQPRMGFGAIDTMREGLREVAHLGIPVVGTITVDSYTRVGDHVSPLERLMAGEELNGYPIVTHSPAQTRDMLDGLYGPSFPIQVRHGTALPQRVIESLVRAGLDATEGGPVSYCLPYSRLPLAQAVEAWAEGCRFLANETEYGHIESFGGCLLGQLCPPSLLLAMTVLEGRFFLQHGVRHMSLSYAQGTHGDQDRAALRALRELARVYLEDATWHVVLYTYMGLFPRTPDGAGELIGDSARLARDTGCERLIVKTVSEAWQIPSVAENVLALRLAATAPTGPAEGATALEDAFFAEILEEARCLVDAVVDLDPDVGKAFIRGFECGILDIPFCLHPDNRGKTTCTIDESGALVWGHTGNLPFSGRKTQRHVAPLGSDKLYRMLNYVVDRYDNGPSERRIERRFMSRSGEEINDRRF
ncbi:methylaspartate mutase [Streptomyces sp. TRM68367]|uniref:methylaspartate mutase n=1 Tax=Streptomyces sp. TRM68367 TaxID=2758415 RepID=UPI00165B2A4D|nr:methylaspartate mutase [Streptomyces sp. TRM68367]MBC9726545.1 methylaspartate mutase [Streptomyces sp. TRM68367]